MWIEDNLLISFSTALQHSAPRRSTQFWYNFILVMALVYRRNMWFEWRKYEVQCVWESNFEQNVFNVLWARITILVWYRTKIADLAEKHPTFFCFFFFFKVSFQVWKLTPVTHPYWRLGLCLNAFTTTIAAKNISLAGPGRERETRTRTRMIVINVWAINSKVQCLIVTKCLLTVDNI